MSVVTRKNGPRACSVSYSAKVNGIGGKSERLSLVEVSLFHKSPIE